MEGLAARDCHAEPVGLTQHEGESERPYGNDDQPVGEASGRREIAARTTAKNPSASPLAIRTRARRIGTSISLRGFGVARNDEHRAGRSPDMEPTELTRG